MLFHVVRVAPTAKRAALAGLAYGTGAAVAGFWWLYISMHTYGGMPAPIAALAVVLLGMAMALYTAFATGVAGWLRRRWKTSDAVMLLAFLPALWALSEWLRGTVFTGFPWISTGYAHNVSPLAGYAPLVGVYGIGLIAAFLSGVLALAIGGSFRRNLRRFLMTCVVVLGLGVGLNLHGWTEPDGAPLSVRLLQTNVQQEMKFAPEQIENTLAMVEVMIRAGRADLIATPETAIPILANRVPAEYIEGLVRFARTSGSHLMIGIPISDSPTAYANSAVGIAPDRDGSYRYDKHHLVPFGEFIPTGFRWFTDLMHIPLGDFTRGGAVQRPFAVRGRFVLPNICYEDLFGEEIAQQLYAAHAANGPVAGVLLNMSNLSWFGDSTAIPQHLQISQMRTLETGRPMLRATNSGATAIVDGTGRVRAQLKHYTRGTLEGEVQPMRGMTPFIVMGNAAVLSLSGVMLLTGWALSRRRRTAAA